MPLRDGPRHRQSRRCRLASRVDHPCRLGVLRAGQSGVGAGQGGLGDVQHLCLGRGVRRRLGSRGRRSGRAGQVDRARREGLVDIDGSFAVGTS